MRIFDRLQRPPAARKPDLTNWQKHELAAVWIGHATVLLRIGGLTILTDPVFSNRVGLGFGLVTGGPPRHTAAAISIRDLPPLDLIIVSHAHFDHLDRPTLDKLPKQTPIVAAHSTSDLIHDLGFRRITEMRWGEEMQVGSVKLTSQQVKHWGARTFYDMHRGFSGFLIEAGRRRVLYGGDSAYCECFGEMGKVDLAILGIAGYDPWIQSHATPEQAWAMANHMRADHVLPIHHSTFKLSYEPMDEPIERMMEVSGNQSERVVVREVGGQWTI
jgi:L-ascorbate metabolism protein UlaG (beta-lactamase superfamily)